MTAVAHEEADPCEHPMAYEARAGVDDDGPWASYRCDDCGWWDTIYNWEVTAAEHGPAEDAQPRRTWEDDHGPMVEPEPDVALERRARAILARLDPDAAHVLQVQGRHVSDRLAAEAADRHDRIEASHAVSRSHDWATYQPYPIDDVQRARATVNGALDERLLALYRRDDNDEDDDHTEDLDTQEQVQ